MRKLALTTTLLLLSTAAPLAAAHFGHDGCTSTTLVHNGVHVDVYDRPCAGVVAYTNASSCPDRDFHDIIQDVHVLVLSGLGCQTGVVLA